MQAENIDEGVAVSSKKTTKKRSNKSTSRSGRPAKALKGSLGAFASNSTNQNSVKNNVKKGKRKTRRRKETKGDSKHVRKKPKKSAKKKRKGELNLSVSDTVANDSVERFKSPRKCDPSESKTHLSNSHSEDFDESKADYDRWCAEQHTQTSIKDVEVDVIRWEHFALLIEEYYEQKDVAWK